MVERKLAADRSAAFFYTIGCVLLANAFFIDAISARFLYELDLTRSPVPWYVVTQVLAGFLLLILPALYKQFEATRARVAFAILAGLVMRLMMFDTNPILEIDFYRYLWDGAVLFNGLNPYATAPLEVQLRNDPVLDQLVLESGVVHGRINYANLTTIYPPLAQFFFALSYWIDSWQLDGWRLILLIADVATLALIVVLLKTLQKSLLWLTMYWWNPLVVSELFNSGHMDGLLVPFLLLAVFLLIKKRHTLSSFFMVMAAAVKIWPLLLIPFCCRPLISTPRRLIVMTGFIITLVILVFLPYFFIDKADSSGLFVFSQEWQRGGGVFELVRHGLQYLTGSEGAGLISRVLIAIFTILLVLYLNVEHPIQPLKLIQSISWSIFVLVLLSPVQLPWYAIWFSAFLCFVPNSAMLLFSALAPLYYLRWYFTQQDDLEVFVELLNWLPIVAVLLLLVCQWIARQKMAPVDQDQSTTAGERSIVSR